MTLTSTLTAMVEAGCTMEQLIAVVRAYEEKIDRKSRAHADRQKRHRDKKRDTTLRNVTQRDARDTTSPLPPTVYSNNIYPPSQHSVDVDNSRRAKRASKGTRLPSDWCPTEEDRMFAADLLPFWETEIDKFRDYWIAKAGDNATKKDWSATWRNWCRNAHERSRPTRKADAAPNLMEIYAARARESERREREEATVLAFGRK